MKKWVCPVCGYVHEGDVPPAECPVCHVSGDKFLLQSEEKSWAAEHVVGVGKVFGDDVPEDVRKEIIDGLRANFEGECSEVGMYLAMARVAHREGYPEIGLYWEKAGLEEAEHAAKFAELLGEVITDSTKKNLQMRVDAENGATAGKFELAKLAKKYNLDAIHDTVHEMARDEARHGRALKVAQGLPQRRAGKQGSAHPLSHLAQPRTDEIEYQGARYEAHQAVAESGECLRALCQPVTHALHGALNCAESFRAKAANRAQSIAEHARECATQFFRSALCAADRFIE